MLADDEQVSWVRHRDLHILTVGSYTYTSDQRFQASHHRDLDEWTLHIKWAQRRDAGVYECQVSTQPVRSLAVTLNIVVPTATILGGPDLYVNKGSTINLTCTIRYSPEPPAFIFWYHHDEVISYDSERGGVSVVTDKGEQTTSRLLLQKARPSDSGHYTCRPSNADVATVTVHVLDGERPEAMQTGASAPRCLSIVATAASLLAAAAAVLTSSGGRLGNSDSARVCGVLTALLLPAGLPGIALDRESTSRHRGSAISESGNRNVTPGALLR
ncbi:zwei Ig domain protein zig-8-like [Schistocerca americana]|uniref:zwei Ig domain protein zig-8-like n=1 Tax=Schistocerca americana TaxID=7009 RepID=UPI001F4FED04|nr:zwei Ig domain protein zig-8-like [Schistocerca americana]